MSNYILSCCSTADLSKEHFAERDIQYIYFHYELDGKEYKDDLGESMAFEDFYRAMQEGADTKTSQVNASEYEEYFESFLKEGKDILHVSLSSGIVSPVFVIETVISSSLSFTSISSVPYSGENFIALSSRFIHTCFKSS